MGVGRVRRLGTWCVRRIAAYSTEGGAVVFWTMVGVFFCLSQSWSLCCRIWQETLLFKCWKNFKPQCHPCPVFALAFCPLDQGWFLVDTQEGPGMTGTTAPGGPWRIKHTQTHTSAFVHDKKWQTLVVSGHPLTFLSGWQTDPGLRSPWWQHRVSTTKCVNQGICCSVFRMKTYQRWLEEEMKAWWCRWWNRFGAAVLCSLGSHSILSLTWTVYALLSWEPDGLNKPFLWQALELQFLSFWVLLF